MPEGNLGLFHRTGIRSEVVRLADSEQTCISSSWNNGFAEDTAFLPAFYC